MDYSREDYQGYRTVNRHFAAALSPLLRPDDIVWIHDYHLIPLGRELRELGHANRLGFFLHIPFPPAGVFDALPCARALVRDLAACDLIGFQTDEDSDNFLSSATRLAGASLGSEGRFRLDDTESRSTAIPVGIDPGRFARQAERAANSENARRMRESLSGRRLIIGVDRLDYSKGLPNRLEAYTRLLEQFPEHRLKVSYLQVTPRSRGDVGEYQVLKRNLDRQIGKINGKFAEFDWVPLRYMTRGLPRNDSRRLLSRRRRRLGDAIARRNELGRQGVYRRAGALDPGVLVLSRFAGAAAHMKEAIIVNPYDPDEVAEAINDALVMPGDERRARAGKRFMRPSTGIRPPPGASAFLTNWRESTSRFARDTGRCRVIYRIKAESCLNSGVPAAPKASKITISVVTTQYRPVACGRWRDLRKSRARDDIASATA